MKARGPREVLLAGGVGQSRRVRENFEAWLAEREMTLVDGADDALFLDALGCAVLAAERPAASAAARGPRPPREHGALDRLAAALRRRCRGSGGCARAPRRRRRERPGPPRPRHRLDRLEGRRARRGDARAGVGGYARTAGDPVGAAQELVRTSPQGPCAGRAIVGVGVTGSGREIVGSLMATCYGAERVHVLNEIAAHAEGARAYDPRVDTIFEIGGQDAKYIRLEGGRVVDAAMNEACSAGTGSFIEEQGRRLGGLGVAELGEEALARGRLRRARPALRRLHGRDPRRGGRGRRDRPPLIAGLYDSVIQNYLNRVKGQRSVGEVIFCQGMPFSADALAAAVARQTGAEVIVPPSPGTVGAFGIALLAREAIVRRRARRSTPRASSTRASRRRTSSSASRRRAAAGAATSAASIGCARVVDGQRQAFTWGGACSLYDKGTRTRKLPDGAPDPFRERAEAVERDRPCARPPSAARAPAASRSPRRSS